MTPIITFYRVQEAKGPLRRKWQAEWDLCPWCPRAYTRRGIERKAARWSDRNLERQLCLAHRRQWLRAHVTHRTDPFYASIRPHLHWRFKP